VLGKNGKPPNKAFMEAMPYTQSLLANGMGVGYHAIAAAPTVTMPRLKVSVNFSFKCGSVKKEHIICVSFFFFFFVSTSYFILCLSFRPWFLEQLGVSWMWLPTLTPRLIQMTILLVS
jgi:hypothetical protein